MPTYVDPWPDWVMGYGNTTTQTITSGSSANVAWGRWVQGIYVPTATTWTPDYDRVWRGWVTTANTMFANNHVVRMNYNTPPPPTEEQQRRSRRLHGIQRARRLSAGVKAADLLNSVLNDAQREELARHHRVTVRTRGRCFTFDATQKMHNVHELDAEGRRIRELCIYATGGVPLEDNLAAQILMLKTEPEEFERIANIWNLSPPSRQLAPA